MNILPKKSWHVRNKKNIERVRRDEAEAARLEGLERERVLRAEQEARLRQLRIKAGVSEPDTIESQHINLFENCQDYQQTTNKDHEKEKLEEEVRLQQKAGVWNKLVRSEDVNKPWYCDRTLNLVNKPIKPDQNEEPHFEKKSAIKQDSILRMYDPMTAIKEAERIAKEKQNERLRMLKQLSEPQRMTLQNYEFYKHVPPPQITKSESVGKPQQTSSKSIPKPDSDSSPEIIKIVSSRQKKKSLKKSKSKKSKKHKKSHKHHHRHR